MYTFVFRGGARVPAIVIAVSLDRITEVLRPDDGSWGDFFRSMSSQDDVRNSRPAASEKVWATKGIQSQKMPVPKPQSKAELRAAAEALFNKPLSPVKKAALAPMPQLVLRTDLLSLALSAPALISKPQEYNWSSPRPVQKAPGGSPEQPKDLRFTGRCHDKTRDK